MAPTTLTPLLAPPRARTTVAPTPAPVPATQLRGGEPPPAPALPAPQRDIALDLLRGLAIVILVVNHVHLESPLEHATRALLSAAEVLVAVSGVVVGIVFGRRWRTLGARATTLLLLRRSRKLYVASVVVVALVGLATLVPGLQTDVLTVSPRRPDVDLYAFDGILRTLLAIVTLEAGPWQFNILGLFVALLAAAPLVLWALARGWWPAVLATSVALYLLGRATRVDVLPSQSEVAFPLLVWQLLFVPGVVLGFHRERVARAVRASGGAVATVVVLAALTAAYVRLHGPGLGLDAAGWVRWEDEHLGKTWLDGARVLIMLSLIAGLYLALRRWQPAVERLAGPALLPFGRNSFYVFIVHVFLSLAVASTPGLRGDGPGAAGNLVVQVACLALLWTMLRHRFLFRWIPR